MCCRRVNVDLFAPGLELYSTYLGGGYGYMSGTSMATPVVAGVAALLQQTALAAGEQLNSPSRPPGQRQIKKQRLGLWGSSLLPPYQTAGPQQRGAACLSGRVLWSAGLRVCVCSIDSLLCKACVLVLPSSPLRSLAPFLAARPFPRLHPPACTQHSVLAPPPRRLGPSLCQAGA